MRCPLSKQNGHGTPPRPDHLRRFWTRSGHERATFAAVHPLTSAHDPWCWEAHETARVHRALSCAAATESRRTKIKNTSTCVMRSSGTMKVGMKYVACNIPGTSPEALP